MITLPNMVEAVMDMRARDNKRYPCQSNRASSLGYAVPELQGCLRRGVFDRTRWQEKELWEVDSLLRFEEGKRQEEHVLDDLAAAGFRLIEQQTPYEWKEHQITGHIDGKVLVDGVAIPVEIKSSAPYIFSGITDFESLKGKFWLRAYMAQITLYMLMQNVDQGIFIFKDKSSGLLKQINVALDYELGEYCIRAAEAINKHIAAGTEPPEIEDREVCKMCPFKHLCHPTIQFGCPLKVNDDPKFEERLTEALSLKEQAATYKKQWDLVRSEAKASAENGELNMIVGKYQLTGSSDKRGSFKLNVAVL